MLQGGGGAFGVPGEEDERQRTEVFQKYNKLLHVGIRTADSNGGSRRRKGKDKVELLSMAFLKKYLHYAKTRIKPVLTQEAADFISHEYAELRAAKEGEGDRYRVSFSNIPIWKRWLLTSFLFCL